MNLKNILKIEIKDKTLFPEYLLKEIISIREGFDYQIQIGENKVEMALSDYDYFNASKEFEEELLKTNISEVAKKIDCKKCNKY